MAYQQPPMRQAMLPPAVSSRLNEIFDAIRHEFEAFSQDSSRRDDYEQKRTCACLLSRRLIKC